MKHILDTILLSLLLVGTAAAQDAKPNIVYILADDLGYGDVRVLNPQRGKIPTPHLDQLAAEGMRFTDAHSGSSVCTPTRYGVLTGRYAWRTRLQSGVLDGYVQPLIAADRLTVPQLLSQQGYESACVGKWHLGYTITGEGKTGGKSPDAGPLGGAPLGSVTPDGPLSRGFDTFFGFHHARMMKSVFEQDRVTQIVEPVDMLPTLARYSRDYIARRAGSEKPFFLYLPLSSPHSPVVPAAEWKGKSGLGDYGDFVMQTDWVVGEVLGALDAAGLSDNTLVIFTSDNGCSTTAKIPALEAAGHHVSGPFRGIKADIFDGGHRVPFIVRWPGRVRANSESAHLVCLTDLMATCADLLNVKLPDNAGEDSVSFLPVLLGDIAASARESVVHHSINGSFAIRQGSLKLALCGDSGGWSEPKPGSEAAKSLPDTQLYDLSADVAEANNLQAERPADVDRLTAVLEKIIADGRSTPGVTQENDVPVQLRKARSGSGQAEQ